MAAAARSGGCATIRRVRWTSRRSLHWRCVFPRIWRRRATMTPIGTVSMTIYSMPTRRSSQRRHGYRWVRPRPRRFATVTRPDGAVVERSRDLLATITRLSTTRNEMASPVASHRRRRRHGGASRAALRAAATPCARRVAASTSSSPCWTDPGGRRPGHGFASDARKEDEVVALVDQIESAIGRRSLGSTSAPTAEQHLTRPRGAI